MEDYTLMQYDAAGETEACAVAAQSDGYARFQPPQVSIHIPRGRRKCYWLVVQIPGTFQLAIAFACAPLLSVVCISIAIHISVHEISNTLQCEEEDVGECFAVLGQWSPFLHPNPPLLRSIDQMSALPSLHLISSHRFC